MKTLALMILCSVTCHFCFGQNKSNLDSLKLALAHATSDTMQVLIYDELMDAQHDRKKQIEFGLQGFNLAKRIHYDKGIMLCGNKVALKMAFDGSYEAIAILLEIKQVAERANNKMELATTLYNLGYAFGKFDKQKGFNYYMLCKNLMEKEGITEDSKHQISLGFGFWYKDDGKHLDSALFYLNKSNQLALKLPTYSPRPNQLLMYFGEVYYKKGQKDLAMNYFRQAVATDANEKAYTYRNIAYIFRDRSQLDSAKFYAEKSIKIAEKSNRPLEIMPSATLLFELYQHTNPTEALKYLIKATAAKDMLFNQDKTRQLEKLAFEDKEREAMNQRKLEAHKTSFENQIKIYGLSALLFGLTIFAFFLYRNNQKEKKAKKLLHHKNEEINHQKDKVEKTLTELKSTQNQLIQKEKLASLGELTAGIAHEIQNPLNFVNNFSELSVDLVKDLKDELKRPEKDEAYIDELFDDLTQNQEKINHHGKRASNIVKGMLEHSRASTGERALTDINALADEYLRLSYHGMRAKDKNFNADYQTDFEGILPKIQVIPQDIGRVLLNLYNNAFYAVHQRYRVETLHATSLPKYTPSVLVGTKQIDNQIMITVKDNGNGIPDNIKAKIFQPFFTTKPTGQGNTGLGLSLSYDIVTKGHGGTLEVETTEGVGSEFIIRLPFKNNG